MRIRRRLGPWLGESVLPAGSTRFIRSGVSRSVATRAAGQRLRVSPHNGRPDAAVVRASMVGSPPSMADISRCLSVLEASRISTCFTPALDWADAKAFLDCGFEIHENLLLMMANMIEAPPATSHDISRARRAHQGEVLEVDELAFSPFWRFDRYALREARQATPASRYTVAMQRRVVGYAVTGQARGRGYLQRLAVHPNFQGQGVASSLVWDGFFWLWNKGVRQVYVNTQIENHRAINLYERLGFQREERGLVVLRWTSSP